MKIRRVVTGHDAHGRSVFVSDSDVPRAATLKNVPGQAFAQVWATTESPRLPDGVADPTLDEGTLVPGPGGTSFLIATLPPDAVMMSPTFDGVAAGEELAKTLPGLIECFEPDCPGMHTTDTIDYGIVLEGEIWLDLGNGDEKLITKGDVVVQKGARHAWRNRTEKPVTIAFVLIGGTRER